MDHIETVAAKIPGLLVGSRWGELRAVLREVVPTLPAGDFAEVGCFVGQSTVLLADFAKASDRFVWAIDLFPSKEEWSAGFVTTTNGEQIPLYPHGQEDIAKGGINLARDMVAQHSETGSQLGWFLENVATAGYGDQIATFKGTSAQFSSAYSTTQIALAFVDGDHAYESVLLDLTSLDRVLTRGGVMVLDDMEFPGVARAAAEFFGDGYETLMQHGYLVAVKK